MVKVFENTPQEYYMDGYLKENLDTAKKVITKDWDMIFCIDGYEGSGKSCLTMQIGYYCNQSLTLSHVVFTPKQFQDAIINSRKYDVVIYDEAYTGLSSRAAMSMVNRILVKMLAEIRQKNLFIFVVMPTFFDLDKYVALWRSRALIHVYTAENFQRGYFAFYNIDKKKDLYILGKKFYLYSNVKPNFVGRFTNHYTLNEDDYRKKKRNLSIQRESEEIERQQRAEIEDRLFLQVVSNGDFLTHEQRAKIIGIPISTYWYKLNKLKQNNEIEGVYKEN